MAVGRRCLPLFAMVAVLSLVLPLGTAAAHPHDHGATPRVLNPVPAPGDVVPPGAVRVAALAASDQAVERYEVWVDGQQLAAQHSGGDHPTIAATAQLQPGWHAAEVVAANAAGEDRRRWRFRVGAVEIQRLAGGGRIDTAVAISRQRFGASGSARAAVLARADDYPDALAGAPLAASVEGPLLLTDRTALSPQVAEELRRAVRPDGTVYLLGGGAALSDQVRQDVQGLGLRVERLHGPSRDATAAAVATMLPETATAFVASGNEFADALSVSSPAARDRHPILLTRPDVLPDATRAQLETASYQRLVVIGGSAAVSEEVAAQLRQYAPTVERVAGPTRFATAAAVADRFFDAPRTATIASGERFPDALAGGPHAASLGAPLLLVNADRVAAPPAEWFARVRPERAVVFGGTAAVDHAAVHGVQRALASAGGPQITSFAPTGEVRTLDEVSVVFDRGTVPPESTIHVRIGGHEVVGRVETGDFDDTLVFAVDRLPDTAVRGETHEVVVTIAATDGDTWRHAERRFSLTRPLLTLSRGDEGAQVESLQRRLEANGYWVGPVDGVYGTLTHQAVMAFQKAQGLSIDGNFGPETRAALERDPGPPAPRSTSGFVYEVDLATRILLVAVDGETRWVFNTAAGHGEWYTFQGSTYRATTTTGSHTVRRQIDGMREAERGKLWRPKYYDTSRGIAIHGSTSVPATHASAGCVRVTYAAMDFLWTLDPDVGAGVLVYPTDYYD